MVITWPGRQPSLPLPHRYDANVSRKLRRAKRAAVRNRDGTGVTGSSKDEPWVGRRPRSPATQGAAGWWRCTVAAAGQGGCDAGQGNALLGSEHHTPGY